MTDSKLQALNELANSYDGIAVPVTLSAAGHLVTGYVVSANRWHKAFRETLRTVPVEEEGYNDWGQLEAKRESLDKHRALAREMDAQANQDGEEDAQLLHLHDVTIHLGGGQIQSLPWWRVPLDSIVGFAVGVSSSADDQKSPG